MTRIECACISFCRPAAEYADPAKNVPPPPLSTHCLALLQLAEDIGLPVDEGIFGFKPFPELWVGRLAMVRAPALSAQFCHASSSMLPQRVSARCIPSLTCAELRPLHWSEVLQCINCPAVLHAYYTCRRPTALKCLLCMCQNRRASSPAWSRSSSRGAARCSRSGC